MTTLTHIGHTTQRKPGMKRINNNKKELLYKLCIALVIVIFAVALYFNTLNEIERRFGPDDAVNDAVNGVTGENSRR